MSGHGEPFELSFLTLNCWGIPNYAPLVGSKNKTERMQAIADYLSDPKNDLDVVCLQEVWSVEDFDLIRQKCSNTLKYSHRFTSGTIGSGVAILSKYRIDDLLTYRFSVNGYAHHVHRGDWYGGKVVGLAKIYIPQLNRHINVYGTHVHAEYDRITDIYLAHRVVQSVEIAQFIRFTTRDDEFAFLLGDLNLEASDLGYRIITKVAMMRDAWIFNEPRTPDTDSPVDFTCERRDNCYTPFQCCRSKRIDYVMFKAVRHYTVDVVEHKLDMNKLPENPKLNFSDHVAVRVKFSFKRSDKDETKLSPSQILTARQCLNAANDVIDDGMASTRYNRMFFVVIAALLLVLYIFVLFTLINYPESVRIGTAMLVSSALSLIFGFYIWHGAVVLRSEENALLEAKVEIRILGQSIDLRA